MVQLTYDQQKELMSFGQKTGRNILEKTIVYSAQALKTIILFTIDLFRQFFGK